MFSLIQPSMQNRYCYFIAHQTALCTWCSGKFENNLTNFRRLATTRKRKSQTPTFLIKHPRQYYQWTAKKKVWPFGNVTKGCLPFMNLKQKSLLSSKVQFPQQNTTKPTWFSPDSSYSCFWGPSAPPYSASTAWEAHSLGSSNSYWVLATATSLPFLFPTSPYKNKTTTKRQTSFHILTDDNEKVKVFIK